LQRGYKLQYLDVEIIKYSPKYIGKDAKFEVAKFNGSLAILNATLRALKDIPAQSTVSDHFSVLPDRKLKSVCGQDAVQVCRCASVQAHLNLNGHECITFRHLQLAHS
jgi:hypothetical protein